MSYHNIRDKFGRFRPASRREKAAKKAAKKAVKKSRVLKPVKKKHILNVFLLDDTGSMESKVPATVEGFNKVISEAAQTANETGVPSTDTLILFGELGHFEIQDKTLPLSDGRPRTFNITNTTNSVLNGVIRYNPQRPRTALWWSVKRAIEHATMQMEILPKDTKVILTIFTDGEDNVYQFMREAKELVKAKQAEGWIINFVGAGEKEYVEKMSANIGIFASNTLSYMNDDDGTRSAFNKGWCEQSLRIWSQYISRRFFL
jgi:hypothetical protein